MSSADSLGGRVDLRADCGSCFGLCCVVPAFAASADFAIDKPAGHPCPHLQSDFRCGIHDQLRQKGFPGCAVYDCFGAGQKVAQITFAGRDWRRAPAIAPAMFTTFTVMRGLHELLWYLTEALTLAPDRSLRRKIGLVLGEIERLTYLEPEALVKLNTAALRRDVDPLLLRTSEHVRGTAVGDGADRRRVDLIGADLHNADLVCADLRGALLIGADLRGANLRLADVIGADFRGADLGGANLTGCLFLTQNQVDAARGDSDTKLPTSIVRPAHWV